MSKLEDTYRGIALEYIKTNDIRQAYKKYHPKCSDASLQVLPYNLLENVRFKFIKEALVRESNPEVEENINQCLLTLLELSISSERKSDRILAATNYLKFTMGEIQKTKNITDKQLTQLESLRRDIFLHTETKEVKDNSKLT